MSNVATLSGRVLLSAIFIWAGWGKLLAHTATVAYFAKDGLPVPELAYAVAVVVELILGLALLLGLFTTPVAIVLAAWCIATALVAHTGFDDRNNMIHFMKNVAMAGGLLYAAVLGSGSLGLDALIRRRRAVQA